MLYQRAVCERCLLCRAWTPLDELDPAEAHGFEEPRHASEKVCPRCVAELRKERLAEAAAQDIDW